MNSHKFEKYAACFLVAVLSVVLGVRQAFAASTPGDDSGSGAPSDGPEPTCGC